MQTTSIKDNLYKGLNTISRAVPGRSSIPIVQNVLIKTDPDGITLTATNLTMTIRTKVAAIVSREGAITIPAKLFTEFVNTLPNEPVSINVPEGSMIANLTCAKARANIHGADPKDFPPAPALTDGLTASISPKDLKTAISRTAFAAAKDESRPVLTGINIALSESTMVMAAADGFRLAINKTNLDNPAQSEINAIVPAPTLQQLLRLITDDEAPIEMMVTPNTGQIMFRIGQTELISQLLNGEFPDYNRLVPDNQGTKCIFNTKQLLQAAKTAAIFAKEGGGIIRLEMQSGPDTPRQPTALISAQADEVGSNLDQVPMEQMDGEDSKIAFNSAYLIELLSSLDPEQVTVETNNPSSPGVFTIGEDKEYTHVIMPMFIQWP